MKSWKAGIWTSIQQRAPYNRCARIPRRCAGADWPTGWRSRGPLGKLIGAGAAFYQRSASDKDKNNAFIAAIVRAGGDAMLKSGQNARAFGLFAQLPRSGTSDSAGMSGCAMRPPTRFSTAGRQPARLAQLFGALREIEYGALSELRQRIDLVADLKIQGEVVVDASQAESALDRVGSKAESMAAGVGQSAGKPEKL